MQKNTCMQERHTWTQGVLYGNCWEKLFVLCFSKFRLDDHNRIKVYVCYKRQGIHYFKGSICFCIFSPVIFASDVMNSQHQNWEESKHINKKKKPSWKILINVPFKSTVLEMAVTIFLLVWAGKKSNSFLVARLPHKIFQQKWFFTTLNPCQMPGMSTKCY